MATVSSTSELSSYQCCCAVSAQGCHSRAISADSTSPAVSDQSHAVLCMLELVQPGQPGIDTRAQTLEHGRLTCVRHADRLREHDRDSVRQQHHWWRELHRHGSLGRRAVISLLARGHVWRDCSAVWRDCSAVPSAPVICLTVWTAAPREGGARSVLRPHWLSLAVSGPWRECGPT